MDPTLESGPNWLMGGCQLWAWTHQKQVFEGGAYGKHIYIYIHMQWYIIIRQQEVVATQLKEWMLDS
jgi:hypothetical protein